MSQSLIAGSMSQGSRDPLSGNVFSPTNGSNGYGHYDGSIHMNEPFSPSYDFAMPQEYANNPISPERVADERYSDAQRGSSQPGKLFIGGLSPETTRDRLLDYFVQFGDVVDCVVMTDAATGRTRGFGFVTFRDNRSCDRVLTERPHIIDGREVDPKTAVPRQDMDSPRSRDMKRKPRSTSFNHSGPLHTRKCFVGGLPTTVTQEILHHFFSQFGPIEEAVIIHDKQTRMPRGFGFVTFVDAQAADRVVKAHYHDFFGKMVEVKRAEPKIDMSRSPNRYDRRGHSYDPRITSPGPDYHYYGHPGHPSHHPHHSHHPSHRAGMEGRQRSASARALLEEPPAYLQHPPSLPPMGDPLTTGRRRSHSLQPQSPAWLSDPLKEQFARAEHDVETLLNSDSAPSQPSHQDLSAIWGLNGLSNQMSDLSLGTNGNTASAPTSATPLGGPLRDAFLRGSPDVQGVWSNAKPQ